MEQYIHLLIASKTDFCPSPEAVMKFLRGVVDFGVVGDAPAIHFRTLKRVPPQVRTGRNPLTGEPIEIRMPTRVADRQRTLASLAELPSAVGAANEYDVNVSGQALPKVAPLPIDFDQPYHLRIGCRVRAHAVSLSGVDRPSAPRPFEDCAETETMGFFTDPHTGKEIQAPGGGCARFWIEFELGKWLFPKIENGDLRVLNPRLEKLAVKCFRTNFVQGCVCG